MKVLDLFSGIGGFSLGLERAGMETVAFCEYDKKAQLVLKKHWPDVPVYPDIRKLTYERLKADGVVADSNSFRCSPKRIRETISAQKKSKGQIYQSSNGDKTKADENKKGKPKELAGAIDLVCGGFP